MDLHHLPRGVRSFSDLSSLLKTVPQQDTRGPGTDPSRYRESPTCVVERYPGMVTLGTPDSGWRSTMTSQPYTVRKTSTSITSCGGPRRKRVPPFNIKIRSQYWLARFRS